MQSIRRIVVGVDLDGKQIGSTAQLAIDQARAIAARTGAHVTLLHSHKDDERWDPSAESFAPWRQEDPAHSRQALVDAADGLRAAGVDCEIESSPDSPGHAIVQQALREDADLVIVGKRAGPHHDGRRMGSVSLNVVRHCPCLVSVVRPGSRPLPATVVAATDGGDVGTTVVDAAAGLAAICGADLHVIHAIQINLEVQMEGDAAEHAYVARRRDEIRSQAEQQAKDAGLQEKVTVHAGVTTPSRGVLEAVERLQADLVVMGTVSRGGIPGLLVGNTAERLLGTLDCSLLVAKPADFVCPVTLD